MCQSKAEGGQRCYGRALPRFQKAHAAAQADPSEKNTARLTTAATEYASTPGGEADFRAQHEAATAAGRMDEAAMLGRFIEQGLLVRDRNAAVKAAFQPRTVTLMPTKAAKGGTAHEPGSALSAGLRAREHAALPPRPRPSRQPRAPPECLHTQTTTRTATTSTQRTPAISACRTKTTSTVAASLPNTVKTS